MAFRRNDALGTRDIRRFRGCLDSAHTLTCLRIAASVAEERRKARFRVAPAPSPLGRDPHPLDDKPNFRGYRVPSSLRTSLAWSHRCSSVPCNQVALYSMTPWFLRKSL